MSSLQSNEFYPGPSSRPYPNGLAVFNGQLFVVGGGDDHGQIGQTTVPLLSTTDAAGLAKARWSSTTDTTKSLPHVSGRCALVASGTELYLFALSSDGPYVTNYDEMGASGPTWVTPITPLRDMTGNLVPAAEQDIDAKAFGLTGILVAFPSVNPDGSNLLYVGYYDTSDYDSASQTWKARYSVYIPPQYAGAPGPEIGYPGKTLSMDWLLASTGSTGNSQQQAEYLLAIHLTPMLIDGGYLGSVIFFYPFIVNASGAVQSINVSATGPNPAFAWQLPQSNGLGAAIARDPAGRLNVYYYPTAGTGFATLYVNTYTLAAGATPTYVTAPRTISGDGDSIPPSVLYWVSPFSNGQAQAYELLFYSKHLIAEANFFGTAETMQNYATYSPLPKSSGVQSIIQGIFDGPIPYPNVNSQNYSFADTDYYTAGTVTYGVSKSNSKQHQQSFALTAGVQSSGSVTKGIGPAWNVSMNGGFNLGSGQETGSTLGAADNKVSQIEESTNTINPNGSLFLAQALMTLNCYQFTDANGTLITGPKCSSPQSPLGFNIAVTFDQGGAAQNFLPYAVTPGDLASYTPEQINATMNARGYQGNYFGDVILANAFQFSPTQNFLQCIWSDSGGGSAPSFTSFQTSFTESGWTFDTSLYAGVSGGVDVGAFAASVILMAGVSVSMQGSDTDTTDDEWGISIDSPWNGPPPCPSTVGSGIASYTFLIFFLPPPDGTAFTPNYWAQELIKYGPNVPGQTFDTTTVDPNSQCWRITYVVTSYTTNDGQGNYAYNGALGQV